jgi:NNP family nitrate/nitrite transporter-like MFS transporter
VALPNLVGALMRVPYIPVTRLGGRTWTVISAALLVVPILAMVFAVTARPPYWAVLACAAAAGSAAATSRRR